MRFIKVTADPCNSQGTTGGGIPRIEFVLNSDLISAIMGSDVFLINSKLLTLNGKHFTNIRLSAGIKIPD